MSIIQTSCSELLVDTAIHDPQEALDKFTHLLEVLGWESSPPLTLKLLERMKEYNPDLDLGPDIIVYDIEGNRAALYYGNNGYIDCGYYLDYQCNHGDSLCYPIFHEAIRILNGRLIACDGGDTEDYREWESEKYETHSS